MPTMWWFGGTQLATNVLMPIRARQIWLFGPSACSKASAGSSFSCVPQPISAVVVPSSRKPSTLQVLTNSFTSLG